MSDTLLHSPKLFKKRMLGRSFMAALPSFGIVTAFFLTLVSVDSEQWNWLFGSTLAYGVLAWFPISKSRSRVLAPISTYLEHRESGPATDEERKAAFGAVIDLPRKLAWVGTLSWICLGVLISTLMAIRFEQFGVSESVLVSIVGVAAGGVAAAFTFFLVKRGVESIRGQLAREIPDPDERRSLIKPVSLRAKVLTCVSGAATIPLIAVITWSYLHTGDRALEDFTNRWQEDVVEELAVRLDGEESLEAAMVSLLGEAPVLIAPLDVAVLNLTEPDPRAAVSLDSNLLQKIESLIESGVDGGSSASLISEQVFAWRVLGDQRILVAATPRSEIRLDQNEIWAVLGILLVTAIAIGFALAWLLASDVSRAATVLQIEAERLASGDLRRGEVFESEDELGELSRSFESMAGSLRETVQRVVEAADRVEGAAGEIASVSENVAAVTTDQVVGIKQASTSMEAINSQVREIADSSQALNASIEESSSSILELGASGRDLNETARTLAGKVVEVSSSIEQMVRSVSQVVESSDSLSQASVETSASMVEMAGSLREVDSIAEQAEQLSHQVVESAESGQLKVRQTIAGMDAIRVATETAELVIRNLGGRTKEIGAIVDVIDDVADETNLLALNAAIIAAQAGEQGKAFSVVADEIKDLADRVLASTKEIGSLIRAVQEEGANAIGAIEQGTQSVASGVDLSAEAGMSLEEITRASRESGTRIHGIVTAVRDQASAASHVVALMEKVRTGVEEIKVAATEQERGNTVVYRSTTTMREVSQQVNSTTEEQARGSGRIRESVVEIGAAVEKINDALQEQSAVCRSAVEFLEGIFARTRSNEESASRMDEATKGLLRQSSELRENVHRFRI